MRVMVLAILNEDSATGLEPTPEALEAWAAMDKFTEELVQAGIMVAGAGLKPPAEGKRIVCEGAGRTVPKRACSWSTRSPMRLRCATTRLCRRREATFCSGRAGWPRRVRSSRLRRR
jgi:hypothetical protein